MRGYTPKFQVMVGGQDASSGFYGRLVKASLRDEEGQTSDTLTITLDDRDNQIQLPRKGTKLSPSLGYVETSLTPMGLFEVESTELKGSEQGEFVIIQAKGAKLSGDEKAGGREHFEGKTLGDIVRDLAKRAGLEAVIDEKIASVKIPYIARLGQSPLDFITRLADRNNGVMKRAGGKVIVAARGSANAAAGKALPPIMIEKSKDIVKSWSVTPDPRPRYGKVLASWIDQKTGKRQTEEAETGFSGAPKFPLRHPFASKDEAKKAAEAEAARMTTRTGKGSFILYGRPEASAGADVIPRGFRGEINQMWRAHAVEQEFESGAGGSYLTTVEFKAPEKGAKE